MDNTDISTSNKDKTSVFINGVEVYNKKTLNDEICRLIIANVQLITNKMKIEKTRVNLETDKTQLFGKKNSLVVKREELQAKIAALNTTGLFNIPIRGY